MSTIVKFNNKILRLNNKTVGWTAPVPPPVLYHVTANGVNGTVVATPNTGYNGDTITLSNTPDEGYEFDSYSLTGATLYDTNKFDINNSDVNVVGNFTVIPEPVYINPVEVINGDPNFGSYAYWKKSAVENAGGNYNSNYKFVSDNWPSGLSKIELAAINASTFTVYFDTFITNYEFNFSDLCSESDYNKITRFDIYCFNANNQRLNIPLDVKVQLLS